MKTMKAANRSKSRAAKALSASMKSNGVQLRLTAGQRDALIIKATRKAESRRKAVRRAA